ncbi:MAG: helix-turn-helix domain-containing protein [Actinobacteria bacterium]|nr:helix-turn-helix domain-containing protein [Actinomycetota bacterium]
MDTDALTPDEFNAAVSSITASFGDPTRRDIYLLVRQRDDGMTAAEVASAVDLHANVARHHLAAAGHLKVIVARPTSGAGRPSKRYSSTQEDIQLAFPVRRDDLLGTLLGRALSRLPHSEAQALAEEVGREYGLALADSIEPGNAHRSLEAAVGAIADALTSYGFQARAEGAAGELRIVSEGCPFGQAAVEHPVLCAIDRGLVSGMLTGLHGERSPRLSGSVPMGDAVCTTDI